MSSNFNGHVGRYAEERQDTGYILHVHGKDVARDITRGDLPLDVSVVD